MQVRDTVVTINDVEPGLIQAIKAHSNDKGCELKGLVLVNKSYADASPGRHVDTTGMFEEVVCNFDDLDDIQRIIKPYSDRLLCATARYESDIPLFRQLVPFLPYIATPSESALLWSSQKPLMRDRMSNYDRALTPRYQYVEAQDVPRIDELTADFTYPVIVKPSGLVASLLVSKCDTPDELKGCLKNTFERIDEVYDRLFRSSTPSVLVEEMMQGDMYSVDAYVTTEGDVFCLPIVQVITAHSIGLPGFYTYQTKIPVDLPESEIKAAFAACTSAIKAINLNSSTAHIELFLTPTGWKIVELGARIGGHRELLYKEAYGVNHYYNDLAVRMGEKPVMPAKQIAYASGMCIYADHEGIIESISGIEEAKQLSSTVHLHVFSKPGEKAVFAGNGGTMVAEAILSNTDPEQLKKDVTRIRELVKIHVTQEARQLVAA